MKLNFFFNTLFLRFNFINVFTNTIIFEFNLLVFFSLIFSFVFFSEFLKSNNDLNDKFFLLNPLNPIAKVNYLNLKFYLNNMDKNISNSSIFFYVIFNSSITNVLFNVI